MRTTCSATSAPGAGRSSSSASVRRSPAGCGPRSQATRWAGVGFAVADAVAQMLFMPAYPLWALCIFGLDLLVIYGLVVYGGAQFRPA